MPTCKAVLRADTLPIAAVSKHPLTEITKKAVLYFAVFFPSKSFSTNPNSLDGSIFGRRKFFATLAALVWQEEGGTMLLASKNQFLYSSNVQGKLRTKASLLKWVSQSLKT